MKEEIKFLKVRKTVELPSDDLDWFNQAYGGNDDIKSASLSWCLTMLLHNFRSIHDDTGVTPEKCARDAAKEFKSSIDEGMFKDK